MATRSKVMRACPPITCLDCISQLDGVHPAGNSLLSWPNSSCSWGRGMPHSRWSSCLSIRRKKLPCPISRVTTETGSWCHTAVQPFSEYANYPRLLRPVTASLFDTHFRQLMDKFAIGSVPKLIIVTSQGQIISTKGRKEVEDKGIVAFRAWFEESGTQLSREQKILDGIPMKSSASAPADADHQPNAVNGSWPKVQQVPLLWTNCHFCHLLGSNLGWSSPKRKLRSQLRFGPRLKTMCSLDYLVAKGKSRMFSWHALVHELLTRWNGPGMNPTTCLPCIRMDSTFSLEAIILHIDFLTVEFVRLERPTLQLNSPFCDYFQISLLHHWSRKFEFPLDCMNFSPLLRMKMNNTWKWLSNDTSDSYSAIPPQSCQAKPFSHNHGNHN